MTPHERIVLTLIRTCVLTLMVFLTILISTSALWAIVTILRSLHL